MKVVFFLLALFLAWWFGGDLFAPTEAHPPGVLVSDEPWQQNLGGTAPIQLGEYTLQPRAGFRVSARVLGRKSYDSGREGELSPLDLALGWGPMSDTAVLSNITISQSNRFFFWKTPEYPIPRRDIERHASNMHIIPANDSVERALDDIEVGSIVTLTGKLVDISAANGWHWKTSLTRDDTGKGACELFYLESVSIQ